MIYLTTGANGAGKTLITLRDVRAQQLKENRPVYYHGFEMDEAKAAEFGWQKFDPKQWQDLPDGSICIMDECQNEFPLRRSGSEVPDYIQAIAQHRRRRGFDFWMICPHPSLIDVFVRRLIDKPSWHRHLKRAFGADMVSQLRFSSPDMKCEEPGAGARGEVTMVAYPKEVYSWYKSASLHTGKKKIPRAVYVVAACAIAVPAAIFFAYNSVMGNVTKKAPEAVQQQEPGQPGGVQRQGLAKLTAAEYVDQRKPRFEGFAHTAPAYDEITKPVHAPYPAACVKMGDDCRCYTQQATRLQVPKDVCGQIVQYGFFVEWQKPDQTRQEKQQAQQQQQPQQGYQHPQAVQVAAQQPTQQQAQAQSEWLQGLAARNAEVRSALQR